MRFPKPCVGSSNLPKRTTITQGAVKITAPFRVECREPRFEERISALPKFYIFVRKARE